MSKKISRILFFLTGTLFIMPGQVFAAPPKLDEIGQVIGSVFNLVIPIGVLIAVGMIIYGGYMWMMSAGDPGKIKQAQGTLTWSVIGLIFLALVKMLLTLVFNFLGS